MTATYINRYKDKIEFIERDSDEVLMKGSRFLRYGYDQDETGINMVDPSGGPYLTIGTNLRMFFRDDVDRFVNEIKIVDGQNIGIDDTVDVLLKFKKERDL